MSSTPEPELSYSAHMHKSRYDPLCAFCRLQIPFKMPEEVIPAMYQRKLVFFAGAGISSESRDAFPYSLADSVKSQLRIDPKRKLSFPALMTRFSAAPRGERAVYQIIKDRLDSMRAFREVYFWASRFHRELATIPFIEDIITTNWDDLFERECQATPIVTPEDFAAFSDLTGRKVLKIHGSISNYGSIVATEKSYHDCYRRLRTGLIGSQLKVLLASKIVVFVGYSFQDDDFQRIYRLLNKEIRGLAPRSYFVTLDKEVGTKLASIGIDATPIITDGTFFLTKLKKQAVRDKLMIPDKRFGEIPKAYAEVREADQSLEKIRTRSHPEKIFCWWFQDGLRHAFEYISSNRSSGRFSDPESLEHMPHPYMRLRNQQLKLKAYGEVAYIDGFLAALAYFSTARRSRRSLPLYYSYGLGTFRSLKKFAKALDRAPRLFQKANEFALSKTKPMPTEGWVNHHDPYPFMHSA